MSDTVYIVGTGEFDGYDEDSVWTTREGAEARYNELCAASKWLPVLVCRIALDEPDAPQECILHSSKLT